MPVKSVQGIGLVDWWPIILAIALMYIPTYYWLASGPWNTEDQAHGPIVLIVVLWILWSSRKSLYEVRDVAWPIVGSFALGSGLFFYVVGKSQGVPILEVGSQVPIFVGMVLILRGSKTLKMLWFPLIFLLFLVPLPGFILDSLTGPLKYQVSNIVENILYILGYPIARSGVILSIGPYQLLVADACSGLTSMYSLTALGLLYIYLMQRKNKWRNGLLLLSVLPIAFFSNVLRIIGLVLLTYYFGDEVGQGFFHEFTGVFLFAFSILIMLTFDKVLGMLYRKRNLQNTNALF